MTAMQAHNLRTAPRLEANSGFVFNQYDWLDEEKGTALYWFWDSHGKVEQICAAVGASHFTKSQKEALARIVMHANYEALCGNRLIHYSRSKSAKIWSLDRIKKLPYYSYDLIIRAIDFLEFEGLIEHWTGIAGTKGRQSEFRATHRLILSISNISYDMLIPDAPVIIRGSDKGELPLPMTREVRRMAKKVDAQNKLILDTEFTTFTHLKSPMRRIFRETMKFYGRYHALGASWQNARRDTRRFIELDGNETTLLDFSACNPNIAYRLIQTTPPKEIYSCAGFCREDVKLALMILLNAKSKNGAIFTIASHENFGLDFSSKRQGGNFILLREKAKALVKRLGITHAPLVEANMFFGSGLSLMRAESDIADHVMTDLRNLGIVCLPIHDGFIVKVKHRAELNQAMNEHSKLGSQLSIPIEQEY